MNLIHFRLVALAPLFMTAPAVPAPVQNPQPAATVAPWQLQSTLGRPVTDRSYRGKVQIVSFGFSYCPDVCPTTLVTVARALKSLHGKRANVQSLFISVDYHRDSAENLKGYVAAFGPDIIGLTGSRSQIDTVSRAFRAPYAIARDRRGEWQVSHSGYIYLIDQNGKIARRIPYDVKPDRLAGEIRKLLAVRQ